MRYLWLFIIFFCCPAVLFAGDVSLQWSPNSETDLAGYRAFMRPDSSGYLYDSPNWEGVETTCTISPVPDDGKYCFVVRAFDTEGYESGNSNEVCIINASVPDGLPPGKPIQVSITITVTPQ